MAIAVRGLRRREIVLHYEVLARTRGNTLKGACSRPASSISSKSCPFFGVDAEVDGVVHPVESDWCIRS